MMRALLALLALSMSILQVGALPALFLNPASAPLLPVALIAAWGTMRTADEMWPALLLTPIPFAVTSEERLGWFLLALVPTAALLLRESPPESLQRLGRAPLAAALGALGYLVLLWIAAGELRELPGAAGLILGSAGMTAAIALLLAALLWPVRTRRAPGLFG